MDYRLWNTSDVIYFDMYFSDVVEFLLSIMITHTLSLLPLRLPLLACFRFLIQILSKKGHEGSSVMHLSPELSVEERGT